jgi:hypothetical protein
MPRTMSPKSPKEGARMRIGILLFDEVDLLDSGGPYEVF